MINYPDTFDDDATLRPVADNVSEIIADDVNQQTLAIKALETKVGINSSADTNSLDYKVEHIDHVDIVNKGTNTHAQIDSHISASNPHSGSALASDLTTHEADTTEHFHDHSHSAAGDGGALNVESWHRIGDVGEPAFQNGWTNYSAGASFSAAGFYKDTAGVVHLTGLIKSGTIGSVPCFTLPVGYRPDINPTSGGYEDRLLFGTISSSTIGRVDIFSYGEIHLLAPSTNAWVALDGISFKTA